MHRPLLLSLLLLLAAGLCAQSAARWVHHTCPAGERAYEPGHDPELGRRTAGYDLTLTVGHDDWYDPGAATPEWLKAGGVSYFSYLRPGLWASNRLSALVAFRMLPDRGWEVCAYVYDARGKWRTAGELQLAVRDTVSISYRYAADTATFIITGPGGSSTHRFPDFRAAARQLAVGPHHGEHRPAPAPTGIWARLNYVRED